MEYILLEESPFEQLYRISAWKVLQYFLCNTEILKDEKYEKVYNELLNFFVERRKTQFNLKNNDKAGIIDLAKKEYYSFNHNKKVTKKDVDDFVENYNVYNHLLVIRPKK